MAKLMVTILQIRSFIDEARHIDQQPELLPDEMQRIKQLALERLLINLGEATTRIPESEKNKFPDVPWRDISAFRNVLVHDYEGINATIIRDILDSDKLNIMLDAVNQLNPDIEQVRRSNR